MVLAQEKLLFFGRKISILDDPEGKGAEGRAIGGQRDLFDLLAGEPGGDELDLAESTGTRTP